MKQVQHEVSKSLNLKAFPTLGTASSHTGHCVLQNSSGGNKQSARNVGTEMQTMQKPGFAFCFPIIFFFSASRLIFAITDRPHTANTQTLYKVN